MRALVQRVSQASVEVDGKTVGQCGRGLLVLVCAMADDAPGVENILAQKLSKLRIFPDDRGKMNKSIVDIDGEFLVVSQFTLAADTRRGNRPGFSNAAKPEDARRSYENFCALLSDFQLKVETGQFGADMQVTLTNDGPVTVWLDTAEW